MARTLPDGIVEIATPQNPTDALDVTTVQTAVAAAIGTLTSWEVKTNGADYLVVGPTGSPPVGDNADMRILLTFSETTTINSTQEYNTNVYVDATWSMHVGFSPDSGDDDILSTTPGADGHWAGATAPLSGNWSGYIAQGPSTAQSSTTVVAAALSVDGEGEVLSLWHRGSATATRGFVVGAAIAPRDDSLSGVSNGRLYSMHGTQTLALQDDFLSNVTHFPGLSASNLFSLATAYVDGAWTDLKKAYDVGTFTAADSTALLGSDGSMASVPLHMRISGGNWIGWMRNMRVTAHGLAESTLLDESAVAIGTTIGARTSSSEQRIAFRTGAP